ncbi:phytanoyl-CoA dioxygenase family protein [Paenibacillus nasutitermitis]|uniref:Syringomycin biosynthesis enzyme n=1 Tax=Paenibacillus nasutitermitis TaxID=1652958 RepID=A0A916YS08_9BACL|nr:phytanoyl-CoA dioxygenase family protein [Paenibacillus nasutitermitis]GGD58309.1 syringomycin biosynthesis enzyme [Paenibacillus nasutitermitis]
MKRLTDEQKLSYRENGYLIGLPPVFTEEEVANLNLELKELEKLLIPGEQMLHIRDWHMKCKWLYDICTHPQILSYVEDILGPDFFMWGTQFFAKAPHSKDTVAWHQDAYYWPEHLHNAVTVWLAFSAVDEDNGAMRVIPGSHNKGIIKHRKIEGDSVLTLELEHGTFNENEAKSLILESGSVSLHDDHIVHGSPANVSDRWRIGLTIRYSGPAQVSATDYEAFTMRGNPLVREAPVPSEKYARLPVDYHKGDEVVRPKLNS